MQVTHSGWNEKHGAFHYEIFVDETKTDYEIHYRDGTVSKQSTPFREETRDWNHDGDIYPQYGAWFDHYDKDGNYSRGHFWTPEAMVRVVLDAQDDSRRHYGNEVKAIPGIEVPTPDKRPNFDHHLRQTEARAMAQDIERNRKMNMLGIRPPGEPWVR